MYLPYVYLICIYKYIRDAFVLFVCITILLSSDSICKSKSLHLMISVYALHDIHYLYRAGMRIRHKAYIKAAVSHAIDIILCLLQWFDHLAVSFRVNFYWCSCFSELYRLDFIGTSFRFNQDRRGSFLGLQQY